MEHIPIRRVVEKLDEYMAQKDFAAAERHLDYWQSDAKACGDRDGLLAVLNEQIGFYRKQGQEQPALAAAETALDLARRCYDGQTILGTTLVNAATAYKAFGKAETALPLYRQAREIYEACLDREDGRLGGLYNNMALALVDLGNYREAEEFYRRALSVMEHVPGGALECAVTCCNLADLAAAEQGREAAVQRVAQLLARAMALLDDGTASRNGYYAFVCEKCAPCFGDHGFPAQQQLLQQRAAEIYQRLK